MINLYPVADGYEQLLADNRFRNRLLLQWALCFLHVCAMYAESR
jgi:hypothetical protein